MNNKYVMTRSRTVAFLKENYVKFLYNCMKLSRYEMEPGEISALLENNPEETEEQIALGNYVEAFEFLIENKETANYEILVHLHKILMKGLNDGVKSELNEDQILHLDEMINQPVKANTEIAIDVMMYILSKKLFEDGDVRVALMFANKIMIDNGNGIITVAPVYDSEFRTKMKAFHEGNNEFRDWLYRYCVQGVRIDY